MKLKVIRVFTGSMRKKLLVSVLVLLSTGMGTGGLISTSIFVNNAEKAAESTVKEIAKSLKQQFTQEIESSNTRARSLVVQSTGGEALSKLVEGDAGIQGIQVVDLQPEPRVSSEGFQSSVAHPQSFVLGEDLTRELAGWTHSAAAVDHDVYYSSIEIDGQRFHRIATPLVKQAGVVSKAMITYLAPDALKNLFSGLGEYEKFLFESRSGRILERSLGIPIEGLEVKNTMPSSVLREVQQNETLNNGQFRYAPKPSNAWYAGLARKTLASGLIDDTFIGSYFKAPFGDLIVSVFIPEKTVLKPVLSVAILSIFAGLAILSLAVVYAVFFADSIVRPVKALVEASKKLSTGDFSVRTQPQTEDELATLADAFNDMAEGLAERERIKEVFGKFHSKAVFQKLVQEDRIRLGGERIPVTVFFSDIRSFTSSSEKMSPEAVVEMLNEYMSEMVAVIEKYDGVVDKYVGDAIMAIWGMPTHVPSVDADKAILACLEMREKLAELNARRSARGQDAIHIGMGLNSGEVIAGNIGSPSRMEYTVIGDTVNTASRMESLTKEFKTDFLINESTVKLVQASKFELAGPFEAAAKGKAEVSLVYRCMGLATDNSTLPETPSQLPEAA